MLSKEQVSLLQKIKNQEIKSFKDEYNSNGMLQDLVKDKYVSYRMGIKDADFYIEEYFLTPLGINELSLSIEKRNYNSVTLAVSLVSGALGSIVGALVTYLLMK